MGKGLSGPEPWQSEVTIFAKKKEEKPVNNVSGNWFALLLKSPAADMAEMFAALYTPESKPKTHKGSYNDC